MNKVILILLPVLFLANALVAQDQSPNEHDVVKEGKRLYRSEMASWQGTDLLLARFDNPLEKAGGYFS